MKQFSWQVVHEKEDPKPDEYLKHVEDSWLLGLDPLPQDKWKEWVKGMKK